MLKVRKISKPNELERDSILPHRLYRYLWLLGQFIQHSLLYLQGVRIPDPPELKDVYPDKDPAELINIQHELYGCKLDWNTGTLIVVYKDNQYDISSEAQNIVATTANDDMLAICSFDDRSFDFNTACSEAVKKIIESITTGQIAPL